MHDEIEKILIRKDNWIPSRPWYADIYFKNGRVWLSWLSGFKTKKSVIEYADDIAGHLKIVNEKNKIIAGCFKK